MSKNTSKITNKLISLFNREQESPSQEIQQAEQEKKEEDFSFEEIMKANEQKRLRQEKERNNANDKVKKNFNLKPKK